MKTLAHQSFILMINKSKWWFKLMYFSENLVRTGAQSFGIRRKENQEEMEVVAIYRTQLRMHSTISYVWNTFKETKSIFKCRFKCKEKGWPCKNSQEKYHLWLNEPIKHKPTALTAWKIYSKSWNSVLLSKRLSDKEWLPLAIGCLNI